MAAVAAALGYQLWGSSPVEEMGNDGEDDTGREWVMEEWEERKKRNSTVTKTRG